MKKLDPGKVKVFERGIRAYFKGLMDLYHGGKWKAMATLIGEDETLILTKSRRMYRGKKQIIDFWKQMKAKGLKDIRFEIKRQMVEPADCVRSELGTKGTYLAYDRVHYTLGTYKFIFNPNSKDGEVAYICGHQVICKKGASLLLLS